MPLDGVLTPEEQSYFESGGQAETPQTPETPPVESQIPDPAIQDSERVAPPVEPPTPPREKTMVPLAALIEERRQRQDYERKYQAQQEMLARIEERFKISEEHRLRNEEAQNQRAIPSFEEDPLGHEKARREILERQVQEQGQWRQGFEEQQKQRLQMEDAARQQQQAAMYIGSMVNAYATKNPDYYDAINFLQQQQDKELQFAGVGDPNERLMQIGQRADYFAKTAIKNGKNPAEALHELARHYGHKGRAAAAPSNGTSTGDQRIEQLQRGIAASSTLSQGQTIGTGSGNSLEKLSKMSQEEFDRVYKQDPDLVNRILAEA